MRAVLALCLVFMASAAAAHSPRAAYLGEYLGVYAPVPYCEGEGLVVELTAERFTLGASGCEIAGMDWAVQGRADRELRLDLQMCQAEGASVLDFSVVLLQTPEGLTLQSGDTTLLLQRCTDR